MPDAILCLNAGSSTVKFAVFDPQIGAEPRRRLHGLIDGLAAGAETRLRMRVTSEAGVVEDQCLAPGSALPAIARHVIEFVQARLAPRRIGAVSHRIAHGGETFVGPAVLTQPTLAALDALCPLAPLHQPHNLAMARAAAALLPDALQVGCFDTAFFHDLPDAARRVPLPQSWERQGVRRYGFHGLSYAHLVGRLRQLDPSAAAGRVVFAHLGSGASLCAARDGTPVDTTMGFSPLDGLVMATRCGSLDPGVAIYLMRRGLDADAIEDLLYRRSGLLALSGMSGDMRTLLRSHAPEARAAVDLFVARLVREIGALAASLGGIDALVFSAGIGEHAPEIRARVAERLEWLGLRLDPASNLNGCSRISAAGSLISAWVIPANEEATLASGAARLLPSGLIPAHPANPGPAQASVLHAARPS